MSVSGAAQAEVCIGAVWDMAKQYCKPLDIYKPERKNCVIFYMQFFPI